MSRCTLLPSREAYSYGWEELPLAGLLTGFLPEYEAWGWTPVTDGDLEELERQLGRRPRGVVAVASRCRCGKPQVIVNRPIVSDRSGRLSVFPTLFWLTSPYLVKAVSALEGAGWVGLMRERLEDPRIAQGMQAAHEATARLRLRLCRPEELQALEEQSPPQRRVLAESGVAGMRRTDGVKCLHAHLADYLGRSKVDPDAVNPIGRATAELLLRQGIDLLGDCLPASSRVAAMDVGSNSVRLFIGEWEPVEPTGQPGAAKAPKFGGRHPGRRLRPVVRELVTTRLSQGMQPGGRLERNAREKTLKALSEFAAQAAEAKAPYPVGAATAAVRDAADGGEWLVQIWERTGLSLPAISGEREAELTFLGVMRGFGEKGNRPLITIDVGGRSTELVIGDADGSVVWRTSLPLGAVRLTETFVKSDPVSPDELASLRKAAATALEATGLEQVIGLLVDDAVAKTADVAAVAGSATTFAAIQLGLEPYDPDAVHDSRWKIQDVTELIQRLAALPLAGRRQIKGLQPQRADIIVAGLVVLEQCLLLLGAEEFTVSEADLLQGLIWSRCDN